MRRDHIYFPNVLVVWRGERMWKMRRIIVAKDHLPFDALVMVGVGLFERVLLSNEKLTDVQKLVVNKIDINA